MPLPEYIIKAQTDLEGSRSSSCSETTFETHMMESSMTDVTDIHGDSMMTVKTSVSSLKRLRKQRSVVHLYAKTLLTSQSVLDQIQKIMSQRSRNPSTAHERILDDLPRVDLSRLVDKFESPQPKVYMRKEPIVITERLGSDTDVESEKKSSLMEDIPSFDIKALKNVFEMGEQAHQHLREERKNIEKQEEAPEGFSQTKSVTENFSTVDEFGNTVTGSKMETTSRSQTVTTRGDPPTYADVLRGNVPVLDVPPEASAEELLKNFQQTWAESENVFKNLGFTVSEQHRSQTVSHQHQTVVTGKSV